MAQLVLQVLQVLRLRWLQPRPWQSELAALDSLAHGTGGTTGRTTWQCRWQWWQWWHHRHPVICIICISCAMCPCYAVEYIWLEEKYAGKVPPSQCHACLDWVCSNLIEPWISK